MMRMLHKTNMKTKKELLKIKTIKAKNFLNILRDRLEVEKIVQKTEQENQKDEK